ncbi:hypothetical protein KP509_05G012900 [Ceratopteris richardii]|uniref:ABM domain-containing protein n=1 Tax=Ceratopteris richardii TaxID=49495 RepID=A0A8T2UNZ0_CERRI|nr:hypothetical protein KP509_05G012900 [Ceratopteris richardii]
MGESKKCDHNDGRSREEEAFRKMKPTNEVIIQPLTTPISLCFDWMQVGSLLPIADTMDNNSNNSHGNTEDEHNGECCESTAEQNRAENRFYMVVFRSIRAADADEELLYAADAEAHEEAKRSGGLLTYWYGSLNQERECFATCIWRSREDAIKASKLPNHLKAASLASTMYDFYDLQRYWLTFSSAGEPIFDSVASLISEQ